jgi:lipoate-protein ligase A
MKLRLLGAGGSSSGEFLPGALNMGIDEAILRGVAAGVSQPTLRLYGWQPPCVTIGYFQSMRDEVDLDACRAWGIDTVRRSTGGGAVLHEAEVTYSVILPEGHPLAPADILESYRLICGGIIAGLRILGVSASFAPINDIVAGGKKLSGNAQTRKFGCLLQHGTILLDVDPERMFALLKVPSEKLKGKLIEDVKARVTGLRGLLGREIGFSEAACALAAGFAAEWGPAAGRDWAVELEPGSLSGEERSEAGDIAAEKFSTEAWNLKR